MSARPKLLLIDGYHNIFRAFYAIRELTNSKGQPTNAVFGFVQMLRKILRDEQQAAFETNSKYNYMRDLQQQRGKAKLMPGEPPPSLPTLIGPSAPPTAPGPPPPETATPPENRGE